MSQQLKSEAHRQMAAALCEAQRECRAYSWHQCFSEQKRGRG